MEKSDITRKRFEGYYRGASGQNRQFEWDDEPAGAGGSVSYYGDEARWKNDIHADHINNDEFGRGSRMRGWNKHLDNIGSHEDHYGRGPKGYQRSNERLYEDICEALTKSAFVDPTFIEVSVEDGIVTLTGTVATRGMKKETERVVDTVSGVEDVINLLSLSGEPKGDKIFDKKSPLGKEEEPHKGLSPKIP